MTVAAVGQLTADERRTYCRICPAQCGLILTVEGERVVRAGGDEDHPLSAGYTCPKGRAAPAFHHHPARLDHPLRRGSSGAGKVVTWAALLDDLAERLDAVIGRAGRDGVACYYGTWSWFDSLGRRAAERFMRMVHSQSVYSALTVDAIARSYVAELMGGHASLLANLDVAGTGLTLLVGTNPVVSHGHASGLPDPVSALRTIARRPGCGSWTRCEPRPLASPPATSRCAPAPITSCWPGWCGSCSPRAPTTPTWLSTPSASTSWPPRWRLFPSRWPRLPPVSKGPIWRTWLPR